MKHTELLAPVGSQNALIASIQNGADAVYLSGGRFGARQFAKNFDESALIEAIQYAHIRGVAVYVTVNTLIKDEEWDDVIDYMDFLYVNDVDAVIVQDMGLAAYIRRQYPDLELHASTQMSAHNLYDVKFLKRMGFTRVVVAREMPIEEIERIAKTVDVELEVFVHGALCVSYSGQCLMSSVIGGRSGNRGRCAQPCRQIYTLDDSRDYAISPKDLNVLKDIEKLVEIGVKSLKIEGRMKGPEYAATVVAAYRHQLDGVQGDNHLKQIFNRTYTRGFLMHDRQIIASDAPGNRGEYIGQVAYYDKEKKRLGIQMSKGLHKGDEIQIRRKDSNVGARTDVFYLNNQRVKTFDLNQIIEVDFKYQAHKGEKIFRTYDAQWMDQAAHTYDKEYRKVPVEVFISILEGQSAYMTMEDGLHTVSAVSNMPVEKAQKVALDQERIEKQLSKLGQTAYALTSLDIEMEDGVSLPAKALNDMRRHCTDQLDQLRAKRYDREGNLKRDTLPAAKQIKPRLVVSVRNQDQWNAVKDFGLETYSYGQSEIVRLNRILDTQAMERVFEAYPKAQPMVVGNLGAYDHFSNTVVDYSLNVMNSRSAQVYQGRVTLSYELSCKEINAIRSDNPLELIVYGRVPVMVMAYCPITKQNVHCDRCKAPCMDNHRLIDRYEAAYPLIRSHQRLEVLSSQVLHLMPYLNQLNQHIETYRLDFTIESPDEVRRVTEMYMDYMQTGEITSLENGMAHHFLKGVE